MKRLIENFRSFGGGGTVGSAGSKDAIRCEDAKRQRSKASIIYVILNLFQDLLTRSKDAKRYRCKANINNKLAICHPELCLTAFAEIYDFEQNVPMRVGSHEKQKHKGQSGFQEILKRVQDDINIFLKRTYSHINLFTYSPYKKAAFTLAEVLVTLGIIGVVSAMTVPTLMQNHQRKVFVTQLHKIYNEAQQAALQYITDKNAIDLKEAGLTSTDAAADWIKTYFKVVNDCGTDHSPCFADEYKLMNGASKGQLIPAEMHTFVLASGASIAVLGRTNAKTTLYVDTNGRKGPNIVGRDIFPLLLYKNGIIDESNGSEGNETLTAPLTKEKREEIYEAYCVNGTSASYWWGCFGKILNDGWEMNY